MSPRGRFSKTNLLSLIHTLSQIHMDAAPTAGEEVRLADGGQVQGLDGIYPEIGQSPGLIYAAVGRQCFSPSLSPSQSSPLSFSLYPTPQLRTNSLNTLWVIGARGS